MAVEDMLNDIRFDGAKNTNEIVKESVKGDFNTASLIKDARYDINGRVEGVHSALENRFFDTARDIADVKTQVMGLGYQVRDGFNAAAKDAEINALKTQIELTKQSTYLSDKIDGGNMRTTDLIQALNNGQNERRLIERNTELVAALDDGRFWRHRYDDGQWQNLSTRLQAFQSDLQDTRQGMVNFGTMAGVGQSSTQNTVR